MSLVCSIISVTHSHPFLQHPHSTSLPGSGFAVTNNTRRNASRATGPHEYVGRSIQVFCVDILFPLPVQPLLNSSLYIPPPHLPPPPNISSKLLLRMCHTLPRRHSGTPLIHNKAQATQQYNIHILSVCHVFVHCPYEKETLCTTLDAHK